MTDRLVAAIPFMAFSGRWEEMERHGWRLAQRYWQSDDATWLCVFTRAAAA